MTLSSKATPPEGLATPPAPKLVGALASGLRVLRYLAEAQTPVGVSQIARDLALNPSTCFNLLRTLVHDDLAVFDTGTRKYAVGLGLAHLARHTLEQASHVRLVRPHLEAIATRHGVTATLWQRIGADRVMLVDRVEAGSAMQIHMPIGQRLPLMVAALGRCMAAHSSLSREDLSQVFAALRWQAAPTLKQYLAEVAEARQRGYGLDRGNFVKGVTTASAVVVGSDQVPVSAISTVGFSPQFTEASLASLGAALRDAAQTVTRSLSGGRQRLSATRLPASARKRG